jgi:Ni,Fe-hydrogenase III small subunit
MTVRPRSASFVHVRGFVGASIRVIARSLRNMSEHEFMLNAGWCTLDSDMRAESNRATEALKQSVPLRLCAEKDISNF